MIEEYHAKINRHDPYEDYELLRSFSEVLKRSAERHPEDAALIFEQYYERQAITYGDFYEAILSKAQEIRQLNIECVGIIGSSTPSWLLNVFAWTIAGRRVVMLDESLTNEETKRRMEETGVEFVYSDNRQKLSALKPVAEQIRAVRRLTRPGTPIEVECGGEMLLYSSGTTEAGHAVVLSQEALCASALNGGQLMECFPGDAVVCTLPYTHVYGFVAGILWPMTFGASVIVGNTARFTRQERDRLEATIMVTTSPGLRYVMSSGAFNPHLRAILVGAGPIDRDILEKAQKQCEVRFGYGLTETASGIAMNVENGDLTAMQLCPGTSARIDYDGELIVSTPSMMDGYYHRPEETALRLQDGELSTRDLAHFDENGLLHIDGRKNELLTLKSGEKIFCLPIEQELGQLMGSQVVLSVRENDELVLTVLGPESMRSEVEEKLREFNDSRTDGLHIDRVVLRTEPFPRTITGKIKRYLL